MDTIRIAQTIGITAAAFCAGGTLCISYHYVPSLLIAPSNLMARQWKKSFDTGKIAHPGLALFSSFAYGYLAYQFQGTLKQTAAEVYGICIVANLAIWPWTIFVMMPTNKKLFAKYDESVTTGENEAKTELGAPKGESTKELVQWWSTMNVIRGCMPLVAAILGVWVTV